jgi:long-chain acyl-CoA synthetase
VDVEVDAAAGALIIYTAAFAGRPNGAVLSHTACISQGLVYGHFTRTSGDDVYLNSGPMFHLGTLMHTLATFVFGGTNVFVRRVEGDELCRVIAAEGCTGAFLVGPIFESVLEVNAAGTYDLSTLRTASVGAQWDAMTSRDPSAWAAAPGGYGQTEAVGMMTFSCLGVGDSGPHGRTSPLLQVRIVDDDDNDVPVGEVGELVTRGPTVMNEYWNRPEENAVRSRNGWHHTNDLGMREADGTITFVGPKGRMIKSAAENIYPVEVEKCLALHEAVAEAAIIGVPDPKWVQSVKAIVVLADGASVTPDELIEHCRERIASYKKPRSVEFVDALPRDGFFVDYDALDEQFGGGNYPGGRVRSA